MRRCRGWTSASDADRDLQLHDAGRRRRHRHGDADDHHQRGQRRADGDGRPGQSPDANDLVYEAGLAAGSNAASASEFATGTFTLADPDGLDDLVSVTIDGFGAPVTFTVAQLTGATPGTPLTVRATTAR